MNNNVWQENMQISAANLIARAHYVYMQISRQTRNVLGYVDWTTGQQQQQQQPSSACSSTSAASSVENQKYSNFPPIWLRSEREALMGYWWQTRTILFALPICIYGARFVWKLGGRRCTYMLVEWGVGGGGRTVECMFQKIKLLTESHAELFRQ